MSNLIEILSDETDDGQNSLITPSPYYSYDTFCNMIRSSQTKTSILLNWNIQGLAAK